MDWIIEIFSEKAEQARLIAIVTSAIVAILIVLLNQWFASMRSKRDLLIKKIEELFSASNEYVSACRELLDSLDKQIVENPEKCYSYPGESVNKLNDSIAKMQMICGLYFRSEKFSPENFLIWHMPILEIAHKGKCLEVDKRHTAYEDSKLHITRSRVHLDDLCKRLMLRYGH